MKLNLFLSLTVLAGSISSGANAVRSTIPAVGIHCNGTFRESPNVPKELRTSIRLILENDVERGTPLKPFQSQPFRSSLAIYGNGSLMVDLPEVNSRLSFSTKIHSEADRRQFYSSDHKHNFRTISGNTRLKYAHLNIKSGNAVNLDRGTGYLVLYSEDSQDFRAYYNLTCRLAY
jgi:hypothetical protein